jgi:hypothetical protein
MINSEKTLAAVCGRFEDVEIVQPSSRRGEGPECRQEQWRWREDDVLKHAKGKNLSDLDIVWIWS